MSEAPGVRLTEATGSRIQAAIDRLRSISHDQVKPLLDAKHEADPVAGIAIVPLEGAVNTPDGEYHFHGARVFTSSPEHPNFVNPHFHRFGEEPYVILAGTGGEMNLGKIEGGKVSWETPKNVKVGDTIVVEELQVHSLRNTGEEELDFIFACPDSHLKDDTGIDHPNGDRYLTRQYADGIPPHYPKAS